MLMKYTEWIDQHHPTRDSAHLACVAATKSMARAFPELTRVRGHYRCPLAGHRPHWWLVNPSGAVVDPTARQFAAGGAGEYIPWDESLPEPVGKCMGCGELVYPDSPCAPHACSAECGEWVTR